MKGYKDSSGKFRPTGNRTKSSLKKSDVRKKEGDLDRHNEIFRLLNSKTATNPELMEKRKKEEQLLQHEHLLKNIDELTKKVEKHWYSEGEVLNDDDEDGENFWHIFTSKEDPKLTYEIHWMEDEEEADPPEHPEPVSYNSWYWFDAKDGKGIPSSPHVESESGGWTIHEVYEQYLEDILKEYPEGLQ